MYEIEEIVNNILLGDSLEVLKLIPDESIDMCITSPPYWNLRDYGNNKQLGIENDFEEYLDKLIEIFNEVKRVLKKKGSCYVNIGDVYSKGGNVKKSSLLCIPDRFKIKMIENGWICRNEIIWHKPNAMPSSAKTRFNNDYEKLYFFTKDDLYYFETQYEECKTVKKIKPTTEKKQSSKYKDSSQEASVRQGMNKERGNKIIEVRKKLPSQECFVDFLRKRTNIKEIVEKINIKKTKVEHWFRRDEKGFSYPSVNDWNSIKILFDETTDMEYIKMDEMMTTVEYETDDINKNIDKGRIKRAVWSINTKPFKGEHFAPFPEELVTTPILASCPEGGIVMDIFMGSGTTGLVAKKLGRNYIGIELNNYYIQLANKRINEED